jgi:hypothetical protein
MPGGGEPNPVENKSPPMTWSPARATHADRCGNNVRPEACCRHDRTFHAVALNEEEVPLLIGIERDHPFALGQHDAPERHQSLAAHRFPDDRKGVLPNRIVGGDVIGRVEEAPVDFGAWHKAVDIDRVSAFDLDCLQLFVLDEEKLVFTDS